MALRGIPPLPPPAPGAASRSRAGPSDAALVIAARARERWACEALFRRYAPMANGMALRLMGRDADLDDLVQDSFASALRSLGRLENPNAFASWFGAIVVRTACKVLRRRRLARRLGLRHPESIDVDALVSREAPPDVMAELRTIYTVVQDLPANVRVPLILRRVEEYSLDEIAQLMGASLATVKRRVAEGEELLEMTLARQTRTERSRA